MPSDRFLRTMNRAHRTIRALTLGRIGWHAAGMPVVELTTTGRVSGRPRTVLLTSPVHDDDRLVLIASRGGDPTHPAWYHNLVADPHVTVTTRDEVKTMRARTADADERPKTKRGGAKEKNQQAPRRRTDRPTERVVVVVDGRVRQSTTDVSTTG